MERRGAEKLRDLEALPDREETDWRLWLADRDACRDRTRDPLEDRAERLDRDELLDRADRDEDRDEREEDRAERLDRDGLLDRAELADLPPLPDPERAELRPPPRLPAAGNSAAIDNTSESPKTTTNTDRAAREVCAFPVMALPDATDYDRQRAGPKCPYRNDPCPFACCSYILS